HTSELQSLTNLVCRLLLEKKTCARSEEHTSELQSLTNLVCRLLLDKKEKRGDGTAGRNRRHHGGGVHARDDADQFRKQDEDEEGSFFLNVRAPPVPHLFPRPAPLQV